MGTHTVIVSEREGVDGRRYTITMMPGDGIFGGATRPDNLTMDELLTALIPVTPDSGALRTWRRALEEVQCDVSSWPRVV